MRRTQTGGGVVDSDAAAVRRAARTVNVQITAAAGLLALVIVGVAVVVIVLQSRPSELLEPVPPGQQRIYVDSRELVAALVVIGAGAVAAAGAVSRVVARRAVRPLGDALRIQRTFVADASHELRTPLAALDARIQLLQRRSEPGTPLGDGIRELRTDSRVLVDLVNDLLLAAETTPAAPATPTDAVAAAEAAVDSLRPLAAERAITIDVEHDPAVPVSMPEVSVRRCVTALVDNAVNHSPDHTRVVVRLTTDGTRARLAVTDHGAGIRGIDPERVFDRFAHADPPAHGGARRSGFGIGLALVRDLTVRNGGTVTVAETSERGTTIVVTLPAA
ncbi:sensor histidine kinase [Xylanimonas protaetiae]|uniref:histidine kinase n=1 Tax=Xylanimonas protaetiae TaxID=2509457 RepID=A0A4P6F9H4_9MICO|nr:HAMP domain-containing sensor histidine kinase [Xylanimonas protaetiae]QAY70929.1 HAMP domain-containing histidine kinase [Xylanimonas protaetiae]